VKALTICQPYAELIARGVKKVENRKWHTSYRGPLLIHAGKSLSWICDDLMTEHELTPDNMSFGAFVAVADLVACLPINDIRPGRCGVFYPWLADHDHAEGPWCWVLVNVRRLPRPIGATGAQGLWVPRLTDLYALGNAMPAESGGA